MMLFCALRGRGDFTLFVEINLSLMNEEGKSRMGIVHQVTYSSVKGPTSLSLTFAPDIASSGFKTWKK